MHFFKVNNCYFQVMLSSAKQKWVGGAVLITSISFQTNMDKILVGYQDYREPPNCEISVPGKKLAFISGTCGHAMDSLTFYFD